MRNGTVICLALLTLLPRYHAFSPVVLAEQIVDEDFFHKTTTDFTFSHTYHVDGATGNCSNDGSANSPWLDLSCLSLRNALNGNSTLVIFHSGTYDLKASSGTYGVNGLAINGTGSVTTPVYLTTFGTDAVTITGNECGGHTTISVRQVLNISGSYVIVAGNFSLECGFRHVIQYSGSHIAIRIPSESGAWEDVNKVLVDASHIYIEVLDISHFASSALDWFGAEYVFMTKFNVHDPVADPTTGQVVAIALGVKGGGKYGAFTRGYVQQLSLDGQHAAISIGGAPNLSVDRTDGMGNYLPSVQYLKVIGNTFVGYYGPACAFSGGVDSEFSNNFVSTTFGLCTIGTDPDVRAADVQYLQQPYASSDIIRSNRVSFTPVDCSAGAGHTCYAINTLNTLETVGLISDHNSYYSNSGTSPVFFWGASGQLNLTSYRSSSGTEKNSTIISQ